MLISSKVKNNCFTVSMFNSLIVSVNLIGSVALNLFVLFHCPFCLLFLQRFWDSVWF